MTKKNFKSSEPCIVCKNSKDGEVCLHHLFTKRVYPEFSEEDWNLIPVCQKCHNMFHSKGTVYMAENFPSVKKWLIDHGWYFCEFNKKWRREGF